MATTEQDPVTEVTSLKRQVDSFTTEVAALEIKDHVDYEMAAEMVREVAVFIKKVGEVMDPICAATDNAHKVAVRQRDNLLKPAQDAKKAIGVRMAEWDEVQARIRREAEEAAQRERDRLEQQAREEAETAQRKLQAEAETARLNEAAALEARGDTAGAARLIAEPVSVPVVTPAPVFAPAPLPAAAPKVQGVSYSTVWRAEVVDLAALIRAVAAGQQPITLLQVNTVALNQMARALKEQFAIPGVRAVPTRNTAVRT